MKHHPAWIALCIWFRGHIIFFVACLFIAGPLGLMASLVAFLASLPALLIYIPLCILAGNARSFALRFGIVLVAAATITHFSYLIGADAMDMSSDRDGLWLHVFAVGSTLLSVVSAGYMLQDEKKEIITT